MTAAFTKILWFRVHYKIQYNFLPYHSIHLLYLSSFKFWVISYERLRLTFKVLHNIIHLQYKNLEMPFSLIFQEANLYRHKCNDVINHSGEETAFNSKSPTVTIIIHPKALERRRQRAKARQHKGKWNYESAIELAKHVNFANFANFPRLRNSHALERKGRETWILGRGIPRTKPGTKVVQSPVRYPHLPSGF